MLIRKLNAALLMAAMGILGNGCILNVGPSGRSTYQSCNTGEVCGGSTCQQSGLSLAGMTGGNFCTLACTSNANCPSTGANNGVCLAPAGSGAQCFAKCMGPADCASGTSCGQVNAGGMMISVCVPTGNVAPACGAVGAACCAGGTCTGANVGCASDNICKPGAYTGCTAASANQNAQCVDAPTSAGTRVQTTCQRPMFANAGPDGYCSVACPDNRNESCPSFPGTTTGCYRFMGMTQPMCFADCAANPNICPAATACVMLTGNTGAQVRVCAPPLAM